MATTKSNKITMTAKFPGTCPACKGSIAVGATIAYFRHAAPGARAWHADCLQAKELRSRAFNLGILSMRDGMMEAYYLSLEAKALAKLAILDARIAERLAA